MTDTERMALDARLDAYLDGLLGPADTRETERMLVDPEVAMAMAEAIAFRDLLANAPPGAPPDGLADDIIAALRVDGGVGRRVREDVGDEDDDEHEVTGALDGARWAVEQAGMGRSGRAVLTGMGTMRYALAPFGMGGASEAPAKRPLWRRALSLGRRR